jgi:PBP1b-binding outer membrane lipoprotein LpoB
MTKSKIAALLATLALGAFAVGCSTATNENGNANMTKPANTTAPANTTKPANTAPPANSNMKMPPPKASATKKP